jgi:hypothetical protein
MGPHRRSPWIEPFLPPYTLQWEVNEISLMEVCVCHLVYEIGLTDTTETITISSQDPAPWCLLYNSNLFTVFQISYLYVWSLPDLFEKFILWETVTRVLWVGITLFIQSEFLYADCHSKTQCLILLVPEPPIEYPEPVLSIPDSYNLSP